MRTLSQLSKEMGFKYHIHKQHDEYGYLEFDNGVRHYVSRLDIKVNMLGPHEIAKDKYHTDKFLKKFGYPVIPSELFFSEVFRAIYGYYDRGLEDALEYAQKINYPVIVKPNNGLQGNDVHKVYNEKQLKRALFRVFKKYDKVLVQKFAQGSDYRIIVYDGKFISAYRRNPLTVTGDGERSVLQILEDLQLQAIQENRSVKFDLDSIKTVLRRKKKRITSILKEGETITLLDNANLSTGGYAEDVTKEIHSSYVDMATSVAKDLNLRLSGIDLMVQGDISKEAKKGKWFFLEVNSSPGFDWYSRLGKVQHERVLKLFRKIITDIKNKEIRV
jgi:D-alanine-D-alanine ligase-like ATP-grasp enzyme